MPRTARASAGGSGDHRLHRGTARATVFQKPADSDAFRAALTETTRRVPVRQIGSCLMPNHFHFVAWRRAGGDLSRWMPGLMTAPVCRSLGTPACRATSGRGASRPSRSRRTTPC